MSAEYQKAIWGIVCPTNACGEIDTAHPGYLGSQDTFYVGTLKGVGRVYPPPGRWDGCRSPQTAFAAKGDDIVVVLEHSI